MKPNHPGEKAKDVSGEKAKPLLDFSGFNQSHGTPFHV
jgi:hypothetical protein